ncbi:SgcJ/EcaC family oxidoreductase [Pusillimonas sp.]|uniref:SgcJ/EcaC family oxidoreductase n=1 Tax=Pusillimonas sp. TaxID=3040095 RepID=UPI0037CBE35C
MKHTLVLAAVLSLGLAGCATAPSDTQVAGAQSCQQASQQDIAALFDRWNASLQTGDPKKVVSNYAKRSILLPTMSNRARQTAAEQEDYFQHFLADRPSGTINARMITIGCNSAVDAGLYTFTFGATGNKVAARYTYTYEWTDGQWLITSHHSSAMPEK